MEGLNHLFDALAFLIEVIAIGGVAAAILTFFGFVPICVHRYIEIKLDPSCNEPEVLKKWGIGWNVPENDEDDEWGDGV